MWKHDNALSVTGDEPHYLVIASGLLPHFEVEQTGPYTHESFVTEQFQQTA
jgi:hypothetical protein